MRYVIFGFLLLLLPANSYGQNNMSSSNPDRDIIELLQVFVNKIRSADTAEIHFLIKPAEVNFFRGLQDIRKAAATSNTGLEKIKQYSGVHRRKVKIFYTDGEEMNGRYLGGYSMTVRQEWGKLWVRKLKYLTAEQIAKKHAFIKKSKSKTLPVL